MKYVSECLSAFILPAYMARRPWRPWPLSYRRVWWVTKNKRCPEWWIWDCGEIYIFVLTYTDAGAQIAKPSGFQTSWMIGYHLVRWLSWTHINAEWREIMYLVWTKYNGFALRKYSCSYNTSRARCVAASAKASSHTNWPPPAPKLTDRSDGSMAFLPSTL